jgi:hypothetical protein
MTKKRILADGTELLTKANQLLGGELLIWKRHHLMLQPMGSDCC